MSSNKLLFAGVLAASVRAWPGIAAIDMGNLARLYREGVGVLSEAIVAWRGRSKACGRTKERM